MALTLGSGPFSKQRSSADANYEIEGPEHLLLFEDYPRRMRALLGGETVVDSERGKLLFESNIPPVLYLPEDDLAPGVTESTSHATHCPFKGDAAYWSLKVGDRVAENAVWGYPEPGERARWLKGYVSIYWDAVDQWLQEDEPLVGHLRDPYHRVDVRSSTRRVRVTAGGELLAETTQPKLLFETSLPTRYYIPRADVPAERLSATRHRSRRRGGVASIAATGRGSARVAGALHGHWTRRGTGRAALGARRGGRRAGGHGGGCQPRLHQCGDRDQRDQRRRRGREHRDDLSGAQPVRPVRGTRGPRRRGEARP